LLHINPLSAVDPDSILLNRHIRFVRLMYIDYGHIQIRMLPSDTSFWCRDAYDVEMVKARNSCLHIPSMSLWLLSQVLS